MCARKRLRTDRMTTFVAYRGIRKTATCRDFFMSWLLVSVRLIMMTNTASLCDVSCLCVMTAVAGAEQHPGRDAARGPGHRVQPESQPAVGGPHVSRDAACRSARGEPRVSASSTLWLQKSPHLDSNLCMYCPVRLAVAVVH